jgi:IS30 family transposase
MLSTEAARFEYFVKDNRLRKQFNQEQTRRLIAALLKRYVDHSNREIARMVGCHHTTVSTVRGDMEGRGEISHVENRTDSLGREQPAKKPLPRVPGPGHGAEGARVAR